MRIGDSVTRRDCPAIEGYIIALKEGRANPMTNKTLPVGEGDRERAIGVTDGGKLNYGSVAESGHVEIELPSLPGSPNTRERLHVRDFGAFVAGKIESSMNRQGYLKSGPQQRPHQVFRHYTAAAKGAGLMDQAALGRMAELVGEFEREPDQKEFFAQVIRPYLLTLSPKRR
jgi:hypothetical protein